MDNRNLVQWSQRLYQAIVDANLPPAQLQDVAQALRARTPWGRLKPDVKLAVMKMAVHCQPEEGPALQIVEMPNEDHKDGSANDNVPARNEQSNSGDPGPEAA